ncbi:MAG TPA: hypothetical protein VGM08_04060 [Candidatus Saccharimonadales bacterium]|jgi:hypothetical protein
MPASQPAAQDSTANPLAVDPDTGSSYPAVQADLPAAMDSSTVSSTEPSVLDQPSVSDSTAPAFSSDPAPTTPFGTDQAAPSQQDTVPDVSATAASQPEPAASTPTVDLVAGTQPAAPPDPAPTQVAPVSTTSITDSNDLLELKQQALSQLGPLVNHLEQAPEEQFRTTMMLIQSTDNSALLKQAYDAAQAIADEKTRAQALLDVVNEINYFTQQTGTNTSAV